VTESASVRNILIALSPLLSSVSLLCNCESLVVIMPLLRPTIVLYLYLIYRPLKPSHTYSSLHCLILLSIVLLHFHMDSPLFQVTITSFYSCVHDRLARLLFPIIFAYLQIPILCKCIKGESLPPCSRQPTSIHHLFTS
jgi:hypothetical protein